MLAKGAMCIIYSIHKLYHKLHILCCNVYIINSGAAKFSLHLKIWKGEKYFEGGGEFLRVKFQRGEEGKIMKKEGSEKSHS